MTKIYEQWKERISGERIKHSHVIQLYACVYPMHRGFMVHGKETNLTRAEAHDIITALLTRADGGPRAEAENEERGRLWLAKNARQFDLPKLPWHEITEFRLVGFHVYEERTWGPAPINASISPIWRCHWATGETFDYAPTAWQSGTKAPFWWRQGVKA